MINLCLLSLPLTPAQHEYNIIKVKNSYNVNIQTKSTYWSDDLILLLMIHDGVARGQET